MHKCHNFHAILHKLYMWFGKNQLRLTEQKIFRLGACPPPPKYAHGDHKWVFTFWKQVSWLALLPALYMTNSRKATERKMEAGRSLKLWGLEQALNMRFATDIHVSVSGEFPRNPILLLRKVAQFTVFVQTNLSKTETDRNGLNFGDTHN